MTTTGKEVRVGDRVMLSREGYSRKAAAREGMVTGAARVWLSITPQGLTRALRYRRDTQTDGSNYGYPPRFWTMDQWAERERGIDASAFLSGQGIRIEYGSVWTAVRLAGVLKAALDKKEGTPS